MKPAIYFIVLLSCLTGCRKAQILETTIAGQAVPWTDSSDQHPKHNAFAALINKYHAKGLPGISLLVHDKDGTWTGSTGKADLKTGVDFLPGTVSKVASVTKFFMGVCMFK